MNRFHQILLTAVAVSIPILTGCSTMKVPEFTVKDPAAYAYRAETNGLVVAVQPVTDPKALDDTFRVNLVRKGIVPILVLVDNRSPETFLLAKEKVFVTQAESRTNAAALPKKVAPGSASENTALAGTALLGVSVIAAPAAVVIAAPLLIGGMKAMSNADVIRHNLSDKALASHTVESGKRAYGYLYFELPKGARFEGGHQVVVELTETSNNRPLTFVFNVE